MSVINVKVGDTSFEMNMDPFWQHVDKAQKAFAPLVASDMIPFMPIDQGTLRQSVYPTPDGREVIVPGPYAKYQDGGKVMVDPKLNCAGFMTAKGWRSRNGVKKVLTDRNLQYSDPDAKPHWAKEATKAHSREWVEELGRIAMKGK